MQCGKTVKNQAGRTAIAGALAFVLALLLAGVPVLAFADGPAVITVGSPGEVGPGAEFTVPVAIEGNPGFAAAAFSVVYDRDALELVGISTDGLLQGGLMSSVEADTVGFFSVSDMDSDGELFSMSFRVKDTAAGGPYELQVGLRDGSGKNLVNAATSEVPVSFTPGTVQVTGDGTGAGGGQGTGPATGEPGTGDPGAGEPGTGASGTGQGPATGQGTPSPDAQPKPPAGGTAVTAVGTDGTELSFLMRSADGSREYSLDDGTTWEKVPEDGVIATQDGKTISVDGGGEADFSVKALPEGLARDKAPAQEGLPLPLLLGVAAVVLIGIVAAVLIVRRRRATADEMSRREKWSNGHGPEAHGASGDGAARVGAKNKRGRDTEAPKGRHLKEG
jgi:hypothetical protein